MHAISRVWRYLRDAHFITKQTVILRLRGTVYNAAHSSFILWSLDIKQRASGSFLARGTFQPIHANPALVSASGHRNVRLSVLSKTCLADMAVAAVLGIGACQHMACMHARARLSELWAGVL